MRISSLNVSMDHGVPISDLDAVARFGAKATLHSSRFRHEDFLLQWYSGTAKNGLVVCAESATLQRLSDFCYEIGTISPATNVLASRKDDVAGCCRFPTPQSCRVPV